MNIALLLNVALITNLFFYVQGKRTTKSKKEQPEPEVNPEDSAITLDQEDKDAIPKGKRRRSLSGKSNSHFTFLILYAHPLQITNPLLLTLQMKTKLHPTLNSLLHP